MCKCTCESTIPNYVGKLVFVEAVRSPEDTVKTYSNYYGGEYFVVRQSTAILYGVKIASPDEYHGREIRQLPLIGQGRFEVLSVSTPAPADLDYFVRTLWYNGCKKERGEKLNWVENVYGEAKATAQQMARLLGISLDVPVCSSTGFGDLNHRLKAVEQTLAKLSGVFK